MDKVIPKVFKKFSYGAREALQHRGSGLPRTGLIFYAKSPGMVDTIGLSAAELWAALPAEHRSIYLVDENTLRSAEDIITNIEASEYLNDGGELVGSETKGYAQYAEGTAESVLRKTYGYFDYTLIIRHNIKWVIDGKPSNGLYVNGDPWVVGPVDIIGISPKSSDVASRIQHGSMINPVYGDQGFDSSFGGSVPIGFSSALNVGRPSGSALSSANKLTVTAGSSLVSTRTNDTANIRPQIVDASVLTVVSSHPVYGAFRPSYSGDDKVLSWTTSTINWGLLPTKSKTSITNVPNISTIQSQLDKLWLDYYGGTYNGRELHPSNNMPDYGADMALILGDAAMALSLDFTVAEKMPLAIRLVQIAIDTYGVLQNVTDPTAGWQMGGFLMGGGGHGIGRKMPLLVAGKLLNDNDIISLCSGTDYTIYQEEQQHFFVSQADVDLARYTDDARTRDIYTPEMIGLAEWGEQHYNQPNRDGANWDVYYRGISSPALTGHALLILFMGLVSEWDWPSFFKYQYRWHDTPGADTSWGTSYVSALAEEMWATYAEPYRPSVDSTDPSIPTGLTASAMSAERVDLSWSASTDNEVIKEYNIYRDSALIDYTPYLTYSDTGLTASTLYSYTISAVDAEDNESAQSAAATATTNAVSSYIIEETFGAGTLPLDWTSVDADFQTGRVNIGLNESIRTPSIDIDGTIYGVIVFELSDLSGSRAGDAQISALNNTKIWVIRSTSVNRFYHGTAYVQTSAFLEDQKYYLWFEFIKSTGSNGVLKIWTGTSGIKSSATLLVDITTGTTTVQPTSLLLSHATYSLGGDILIHKIILDDTEIGDVTD